jgi:hypothetical protein
VRSDGGAKYYGVSDVPLRKRWMFGVPRHYAIASQENWVDGIGHRPGSATSNPKQLDLPKRYSVAWRWKPWQRRGAGGQKRGNVGHTSPTLIQFKRRLFSPEKMRFTEATTQPQH